jgi:hypothetical protein
MRKGKGYLKTIAKMKSRNNVWIAVESFHTFAVSIHRLAFPLKPNSKEKLSSFSLLLDYHSQLGR